MDERDPLSDFVRWYAWASSSVLFAMTLAALLYRFAH